MDKKKYHLRIFRHEELDLVLLTISDHGKLKHRKWQNSDFIPRKVNAFIRVLLLTCTPYVFQLRTQPVTG